MNHSYNIVYICLFFSLSEENTEQEVIGLTTSNFVFGNIPFNKCSLNGFVYMAWDREGPS